MGLGKGRIGCGEGGRARFCCRGRGGRVVTFGWEDVVVFCLLLPRG